LYLGAPKALLHPTGHGYALAHEMDSEVDIQKYRAMNHLILDNGADELGTGQGGVRLAYLAGKLNPERIILPDVLHDAEKTRKRSEKFLNKMLMAGYDGGFIAVVQDRDYESAVKTIWDWAENNYVDTIGITYDTQIVVENPSPEPWMRRLDFLEQLISDWRLDGVLDYRETMFHLLGTLEVQELYRIFHDDRYESLRPYLSSHDTTAPYACPTKFVVDAEGIRFGRDKDWPALAFNKRLFSEQEFDVIDWNIACYLSACGVDKSLWTRYLSSRVVEPYWNLIGSCLA